MKPSDVLAALFLGALLFGAGYLVRGRQMDARTDRELRVLRDSAAASRQAAHEADSLRLASNRATDAALAESAVRHVASQLQARTLGAAATRLTDSIYAAAPDTCLVGLQRIRFAWSVHTEADRVADSAAHATIVAYDRSLIESRMQTASVALERDTAAARLDRAMAMPRKSSGFLKGAVIGGGLVLLAVTLAH